MKKTIIALALTISGANLFGQDLTSKKGEPYLPETGDWALGIDATPFLQYAGNFFGKTSTNSAPSFNFLGGQTITGKYFTDATHAYRGSLRIGFGSNTNRVMTADRTVTVGVSTFPAVDPMKENTWKRSSSNIGLSGGMEWRKGKTRLQGYYGAEAGIYLSSSKDVFTYGNALTTGTISPKVNVTNADQFAGAGNVVTVNSTGSFGTGRILERKNGSTFSFGVRGFVGVEYFIWPKISLGGEFGWGLGLTSVGKSTTTIESRGNKTVAQNPADDEVGKTVETSSKRGSFYLDTDNVNSMFGPTGSIRLNFHF